MTSPRSVKRKVTLAVFAAIGVSLALVALGLGFYEFRAAESRLRASLELLTDALLANAVTAVDFEVPEAANELLGRLERGEIIQAATLLRYPVGEAPQVFARYVRRGQSAEFRPDARPDDFYVVGNRALLVTGFVRDGRVVAALQLEGSLDSVRRGLRESLRILAIIFGFLLVLGGLLSQVLQRAITRPIERLAETAREVRATENYALRSEVSGEDELGELGRQFNAMLGGIEERDRRLAESGAFQNVILEGSGVAVISTDPDGGVRTFNPAAERLLGYAKDEVVGRATPVLWHDPTEVAARAKELSFGLGRTITPGFEVFVARANEGRPESSEWTYLRKDGRRVPVFLVVSALRDSTGAIIGYCGLATDLTERRAAEAALRASEHRYSVVVDQTGQMVYDLDVKTGRILWFGESAVVATTGYTLEEFQAVTFNVWKEMIHEDDRPAAVTEFSRCRAAGLRYDAVYRFRRKDGTYRTLQDFGVFMRDGQGEVVRMLGAMSDITKRVEAEAAIRRLNAGLEQRVDERTAELARRVAQVERLNAEQLELMRSVNASQQSADRSAARFQEANANLLAANQELEAFSYSVSHDLRAPLRNITGFIELLTKRADARLDAESQRFLATVTAEARRMGMLIDDLLTFSRIGRAEMSLQRVDLRELVGEVREELRTEIGDREIEWRIGPLPLVSGDRALLRQVLANLLGNAVKFTRRQPAAVVEFGASASRPDEATTTFYVRDNGAGFNPKYLDKLFGVFQRLHNSRDFEGTGIGLANVKRIVERHGGRVWAEGAVERGATFYFTLSRSAGQNERVF